MILECTIKRAKGTHIEANGRMYWFRPVNKDRVHVTLPEDPQQREKVLKALLDREAHVCDVVDKRARALLFRAVDGHGDPVYVEFDPDESPEDRKAAANDARNRAAAADDDDAPLEGDPDAGNADMGTDEPVEQPAKRAKAKKASKADSVKFDPKDFEGGKKAMVAWAEQHLPGAKLNPNLPEGRIVAAIRAHIEKLAAQ